MEKVFEYVCTVKHPCNSLFDYHGVLKKYDNQYVYVFKDGPLVAMHRVDMSGCSISRDSFIVENCKIPDLWVSKDDQVYVSEKSAIDIKKGVIIPNDYCMKEEFDIYALRLSREYYTFDKYVIYNKTPSIYECYDSTSKKKLWKIKLKGYLYHEIELIDNKFVICTAEKGGGIFVIDAFSGKILYSIDTKGTSEMMYKNGYLYSYILGNKGVFLSVLFKDGSIMDSASIVKTTTDSPLLVQDGYALTVSFRQLINMRESGWIPVLTCFLL